MSEKISSYVEAKLKRASGVRISSPARLYRATQNALKRVRHYFLFLQTEIVHRNRLSNFEKRIYYFSIESTVLRILI